jgi:hypothetical protein
MSMTIRTNNVPRPVLHAYELSLSELADFDYLIDVADDASDDDKQTAWFDSGATFIRYRGELYSMNDFVAIVPRSQYRGGYTHAVDDDSPLLRWDAILTDSFFSGIVIRYADRDCETVVVGLALS